MELPEFEFERIGVLKLTYVDRKETQLGRGVLG